MRSMSSAGDAVQAVENAGAEVYLGHTRFIAPDIVGVDGRQLGEPLLFKRADFSQTDVLIAI
jgi:hypothetical protein